MQNDLAETLRFRQCRDLGGCALPLNVGRRNGKPSAFFPPHLTVPTETEPAPTERREQARLFINLNPVERQTWRKLLAAQPIASIAKEEGVSRAAIYARIAGNRKGQGGMIAKNFWVLLWWRLRQQHFKTPIP
jgi:hypothetical protein